MLKNIREVFTAASIPGNKFRHDLLTFMQQLHEFILESTFGRFTCNHVFEKQELFCEFRVTLSLIFLFRKHKHIWHICKNNYRMEYFIDLSLIFTEFSMILVTATSSAVKKSDLLLWNHLLFDLMKNKALITFLYSTTAKNQN